MGNHDNNHASQQTDSCCNEENGCADAFAAVAIIAVIVAAVSFWLHGM